MNKKFTLVELLLVVAVIAILLSLLLPSLNRVQKEAKMGLSISNLKQIDSARRMQINDTKNKAFPRAHRIDNYNYTWDDELAPYLQIDMSEAEKASDNPTYQEAFDVFHCPMDEFPRANGFENKRTYQLDVYKSASVENIFGI